MSFASFAQQVDSSAIRGRLQVKAKHHMFIVSVLSGSGEVKKLNYFNQLRQKMDSVYAPEKLIGVNMPSSLMVEIYSLLSRHESAYCTEIKNAIIQQAANLPWLQNTIVSLNQYANKETEMRVADGLKYLQGID